jgi:hypothetical protein
VGSTLSVISILVKYLRARLVGYRKVLHLGWISLTVFIKKHVFCLIYSLVTLNEAKTNRIEAVEIILTTLKFSVDEVLGKNELLFRHFKTFFF